MDGWTKVVSPAEFSSEAVGTTRSRHDEAGASSVLGIGVIGELMLARMGDEGREAFQEDQRFEDDVGRAVAPGVTELKQDAPLVVERKAVGGFGRAGLGARLELR